MNTGPNVKQRRAERFRFLRHVYDRSHADVAVFLDGNDLAEELGIAHAEVGRIVRYYEELGYLKHIAGGGLTLRITAAGIDHVETAPDEDARER